MLLNKCIFLIMGTEKYSHVRKALNLAEEHLNTRLRLKDYIFCIQYIHMLNTKTFSNELILSRLLYVLTFQKCILLILISKCLTLKYF